MGNDESKNKPSEEMPRTIFVPPRPPPPRPQPQLRPQFSDIEVAELLERQKQHFDKKVEQLTKAHKDSSPTQSPNGPVAGSSGVQHFPPPRAPQVVFSPRAPVVSPAPVSIERNRTPYSYTQSQLNQPSTSQALYPNLNAIHTEKARQPSAPSNFVFASTSTTGNVGRFTPTAPPAPRDRSSSRPRYRPPPKREDEDDQMKCRTCKKIYGVTIFQCPTGHSSCSDCKRSNRPCGICRQRITDMRNITLETVISEMKIKCPNTDDGCHLLIKAADMENHVKECPFGEMACPLNATFGCLWKGKLSQIESHFMGTHPMTLQGAVDTEMTHLNIKNNSHVAYLIVFGNFHFIFHLIVSLNKEQVYMAVQLVGTHISSTKWTYEIHVYHKGQPRRKYQYVDVCQPINTSIHDIMSQSKCAVLPLSYASTFVSDKKLTYKFYIKKEVNDKPFCRNNRGRGGHRK